MICPECNQEIPNSKANKMPLLLCPRCIAAQSYQALLQHQRQFLASIAKDDLPLTLTKPAEEVKWHMAFVNYRQQGWCGRELKNWKQKKRLFYHQITAATPVCDRCREVFEQLAEDQTAEVA